MKPTKVVAVLLLTSGVLLLAIQYRQKVLDNKTNLSLQTLKTSSPTSTSVDKTQSHILAEETSSPVASAKVLPTTVPTATPTILANSGSLNIDNFIYPAATANSKSNSTAQLQTSDSTNAVTEWYKSKLKALGYNATSFVMTNTNGNVLNKLVVAKNNNEIRVEIKKAAGNINTMISVEVK